MPFPLKHNYFLMAPRLFPGLFMGAADADVKSILETLEKETGAVLR